GCGVPETRGVDPRARLERHGEISLRSATPAVSETATAFVRRRVLCPGRERRPCVLASKAIPTGTDRRFAGLPRPGNPRHRRWDVPADGTHLVQRRERVEVAPTHSVGSVLWFSLQVRAGL